MRKRYLLIVLLALFSNFLFGQSIQETQEYIIELIGENNKDYVEYSFKRNKLILYRKPFLATFEETIYFDKADFDKEYVKDTRESTGARRAVDNIHARNSGTDNVYWVYSESHLRKSINNGFNGITAPRIILYGNSDAARRLVNALNHLAKISKKDPFD